MNGADRHDQTPEERRAALLRLARLRRKCAFLEEKLDLQPARLPEATVDVGASAWQLVAGHASDFISIHAPNGDYLFASANCARMFGWAPEELVGRNAYELFHPDDLERIAADHAQHGTGAEGSVQYRLRCKDSSWRWVETRSQAARDQGQIVGITRDIEQARSYQQLLESRGRELEEQLERAREDLLRAEKLATLGTLAAGVGHELNSLSTIYRLALDLVRDRTSVSRPVGTREMALLERVDRHLAAHARHLSTMAQPPMRVEAIDVRALAESTIEILRLAGKLKGIDVTTSGPADPVLVRADRARLEQVLVNLLTNAADALTDARGGAPHRSVHVKIARQADAAVLSVTDSGCGIPESHLAKVFEPYFTTKDPGKGTGLGLPVVRQIAESLGGTATITSTPGKGTTVEVELPAA